MEETFKNKLESLKKEAFNYIIEFIKLKDGEVTIDHIYPGFPATFKIKENQYYIDFQPLSSILFNIGFLFHIADKIKEIENL